MFKPEKKEAALYYVALGGAFVLGLCLRLYLLRDQILIDDEWHGLLFIKGKTFLDVLTQINPFQNSSPLLNVWRYLCYQTVGLSEWNLRLPSLVAGSALVILLPLALRKMLPERVLIIFSYLLAISPFLIFYSRFSRSYIMFTLLAFLGLLAAYKWMTSGKTGFAAAYVAASTLAVYTHLSALPMAMAPYVVLALYFLMRWLKPDTAVIKQVKLTINRVLWILAVHGVALFAVMYNFISKRQTLAVKVKAFSDSDFLTLLQLVSGTASTVLLVLWVVLMFTGLWWLLRKATWFAWLMLLAIPVNVVFIVVVKPFGIESSAIFLRYCIVCLPILLLFVAAGLHRLLQAGESKIAKSRLVKITIVAVPAAFIGTVLFYGPLPVIYRAPNNFTSHLAYQGNYEYGNWQRSHSNHYFPSFEISRDEIPEFYKRLANDPKAKSIIEYPFDFADHSNLCYFYQIYHRKQVMAGYCSDAQRLEMTSTPAMAERIHREQLLLAYTRPEFYFSDAAAKENTRFRTLIDIADDQALRRSGADFIVLHKVIQSIYIKVGEMGNFPLSDQSVYYFAGHFEKLYGAPVYQDDQLIVFSLKH